MQFLFGTFLLLFLFELVSFFFNLLLVALFCSSFLCCFGKLNLMLSSIFSSKDLILRFVVLRLPQAC